MVLVSYKPIVLVGCIAMVRHFLQAGQKRATLPCMEEPMTTLDFITVLFYEVDEQLRTIPKHPEARLWPSEVVTLGLLHALKGVGNRAFYRWLTRDYRAFEFIPIKSLVAKGSGAPGSYVTNGVSIFKTNSTRWPYCSGHAL